MIKKPHHICRKKMHQALQMATWLLLGLTIPQTGISQPDTTVTKMTFDLGITRDRNINLWPVFKRTKTEEESDRQIIFPIYQSYRNFKLGEKSIRVLPIYWRDSSASEENRRFISTYYPSVIHLSNETVEKTKTFTLLELAPRINVLEFTKSKDGLVMKNNLLFFLWYKNNLITKKSYLVLFPAYWQFKNPKWDSYTLFPLISYGKYNNKENRFLAVTPIFWNFKSPIRNGSTLFPVWWSQKIGQGPEAMRSRLLLPVYYSYKDLLTSKLVLFPIVWSSKNPKYESLTIAPLVSTGHSPSGVSRHLMVTPLFWHFKTDVSESNTLFPFVWSRTWKTRTEESASLVLFPLYWSNRDNESRSQIVIPFIWSYSNPYYRSFSFVPLFSMGKTPNGAAGHAMVTPLFWHFKSPEAVSNTLIPIWWNRRIGVGENAKTRNVIFPLYWAWTDPTYSGNILLPLVWRFKNLDYQTFTFAPILSTGKSTDGKRSYLAVTPFYWRFNTNQGKGQLLFPLWYQKSKAAATGDTSLSRVVLLYWNYNDPARNHKGVFPLVWSFKNQTRQSFTLFPLYTHAQTRDGENSYIAITPLFWHFSKPLRSSSILFPVWYSRRIGVGTDANVTRLLLPVYYGHKDSQRNNHVVFPLVWSLRNPNYSSLTLMPIFSQGEDRSGDYKHLVVTPFFWLFQNPNGYTSTLFPILWHSQELGCTRNTLFPIYWSVNDGWRNHRVVFPFVWSFTTPENRSLTMAPLFSVGKNDETKQSHLVITPLFWHFKNPNGHSNTLFPIWWSSRSGDSLNQRKLDVLFPLIWSLRKPNNNTNVVFPLLWSFNNPRNRSFTFAPLYSQGKRSNGKSHLMVTPLFWKVDSKVTHRQMLLPLYSTYRDTFATSRFNLLFFVVRHQSTPNSKNLSIVWPLVERTTAPSYRYFRIAPIVWSKWSPQSSYFTVQPFYFHSIDTTRETYRILWEVYTHKNQLGVKKSNGILWKVVTWERYPNGDHSFRALHLLYANINLRGKQEKSLFPLYYFTKENNGNYSRSVAFYFYNSFKQLIPNTKDYYQEERIFWFIRLRSNYQTLKAKGVLNNRRL